MAATCFQCKKDLEDSQLRCDLCYNSYHPKCCDVSNTKLKALVSIRDMVTWMCPTCTKLNPIEKLNLILGVQKELQGKLDKLSKDVEEMKSQQIIMKPTQPEDLIGEIEERHRKKKNLLLVGLKPEADMKVQVANFISAHLVPNFPEDKIDKVWQIQGTQNKPDRPLITVRFNKFEDRNIVLRNSGKLRKSDKQEVKSVYVNPDYTFAQRKKLRELRQELTAKRVEGIELVIRDFKLIPMANIRRNPKK